jgi:CheY-like chemotaxis protein
MEELQTIRDISGLKILIAEDDEPSDLLITIALEKIRLEFLHAKTGIEAVDTCRSNPDIDLVLMDIKMPEMDGYEATRQIRQFNNKVIIIAQTAYALSGDREMAIEAGCNDYISKPIKNDELIELINKYF